jgi:hypothetical protein
MMKEMNSCFTYIPAIQMAGNLSLNLSACNPKESVEDGASNAHNSASAEAHAPGFEVPVCDA